MIVVRPGPAADVPAALAVFVEAEAARTGSPVGSAEETTTGTRLRDGGGWLLVAADGGDVVGMAAGFDARTDDGAGAVIPGLCHLSLVPVRPAWWGRGVGGSLVDAALAEAARRGHDRIQLWAHEDNVRAQRLYARRGFARTGRTKPDDRGEVIALWARRLADVSVS